MESTRRLEIELSEELADFVRASVESGRYASESEVVLAALELLDAPEKADAGEEAWLRATVPARLQALDEGRVRTKAVAEARRSLAARRTGRGKAA